MSMLFGPASSDPAVSGLPRGEVLGSYPTYLEARKVVDQLAEKEFDVRKVSIVGTDLRTVERIRNRLTYPSVALRSAIQGAFFGLMIGLLMTLIDPAGTGIQILYTVGLGVAIWVIFGVIGHAMRKGRGVDSVQQLVPSSFDVVCEFETAAQAKQLLGSPGQVQQSPVQQSAVQTPANQPPAPADDQGSVVPDGTTRGNPAVAATPSAAAPAESPGEAPVSETEAPARDGAFPDLPDGRPQYGVRLPADEAKVVQERILRENAARNGQTGEGAGTYAAPAYGKGGADHTGGSGRRSDPNRPVDGGAAPAAEGDRPASDTGNGDAGENGTETDPGSERRD